MKKEKWLLKEIDAWEQLSIINGETALILKERYVRKKNINFLILLFSIIGALLIGAGIILILAKNWYALPFFLRVAIAFLPLIISQALAVYVLKFKYDSLIWREPAAILVTASVFASIAMVGQVFHLSGDFGAYVLTCGLLSLPVIYILNAAAPLLIYYWTILNWAALNISWENALILLALFIVGALFIFINGRQINARIIYLTWLTVIAGFPAIIIIGIMLKTSLLLILLCYFVLLLSVEGLSEQLLLPFKTAGLIGSFITISVLTYENMWKSSYNYIFDIINIGGLIAAAVLLIAALFFAVRIFKRDKLKFLHVVSLLFVCVIRCIWLAYELDMFGFMFMLVCNIILFLIGVGFIVHGVKNTALLTANIGMAAVCLLIVMRFFDSGMDFLWRGIVFLITGIIFLLVNLKILSIRKQTKQETDI